MTGWLARLRHRVAELRWWVDAADALRRGDAETRTSLAALLAAVLGLQILRARIRKWRRGLVVAQVVLRDGVEGVLRQHFLGRLIGIRLYRRLLRWVAGRRSAWTAQRPPTH